MLRVLLEGCKVRVSVAASVAEGLAAFHGQRPDLILCDIGMPEEDGYSFIERVRALPPAQGGRTPAVALTAYARAEDQAHALRSGFERHCPKPINAGELLAALASLVSQGAG